MLGALDCLEMKTELVLLAAEKFDSYILVLLIGHSLLNDPFQYFDTLVFQVIIGKSDTKIF